MTNIEVEELVVSALKQAPSQETNLPIQFTEQEEEIVKQWKEKYQEAFDKFGTERAANRKINNKSAFRLGSYKFGK